MNYYDFKKARVLIEQNASNLVRASLGMAQDWWWTAITVWEGGKWQQELFDGDIVAQSEAYNAELVDALKDKTGGEERLSARAAIGEKYKGIMIAGIAGSSWATPSLMLEFADGTERMIECFITDGKEGKPTCMPVLGVMSGPMQDRLPPLEKQP